jgi:hypothetical protein
MILFKEMIVYVLNLLALLGKNKDIPSGKMIFTY